MNPEGREEVEALEVEERVRPRSADAVGLYLNQIGRIALLTAKQEVEIGRRIETAQLALRTALGGLPLVIRSLVDPGDAGETARLQASLVDALVRRVDEADRAVRLAKRQMAEANLRLVVSIARRYRQSGLSLLDLIQEGNLGLLKAIDRFQYRRGFRFSTYATWWIRQAISRAIAHCGRTIRMPVHLVERLNKITRVRRAMRAQSGRDPSPEELARRLGIPAKKIRSVLDAASDPVSLEWPVGGDAVLGDLLADPSVTSPMDDLLIQNLATQVDRALARLSPKEREIVRLRFGIGDSESQTLAEIGQRFGLTRERIRQIEVRALRKLRRSPLEAFSPS